MTIALLLSTLFLMGNILILYRQRVNSRVMKCHIWSIMDRFNSHGHNMVTLLCFWKLDAL